MKKLSFYSRLVRKTIFAFIVLASLLFFFYFTSEAQRPDKLHSFGVGLDLGVSPNVGQTQLFILGLSARFSMREGPGFVYIGSGWMISRLLWDFQIPVRAGYKFIFSKKVFVTGEFGYYTAHNFAYLEHSGTTEGLSISPSFGVQLGIFELELRGNIIVNEGDLSTIGISMGWNF